MAKAQILCSILNGYYLSYKVNFNNDRILKDYSVAYKIDSWVHDYYELRCSIQYVC